MCLPHLEGEGDGEVDPELREAFPFNTVVWWRCGKDGGRVPAQVRPHTALGMKLSQ
jgi:hypothetical protein